MVTTFVFDTVIVTSDSKNYYTRTLHYSLWENRYAEFFGDINVVTRVKVDTEENISDNEMLQLINGPGVKVNPVINYSKITDALKKKSNIKKELCEQIKSADFIIIRMPSVLGAFAAKICKKINKPYLIELVADPWDGYYYHTHWAGKLIAPIMYSSTKKIVKSSENVLYVTEDFLQKRYPSNGKNVCGLSDVIIRSPEISEIKDAVDKKVQNINNNNIKLGIVGNYDLKTKGQELAIRALERLKNDKAIFNLELVGSGDSTYLESIVKDCKVDNQVKFIGSKKAGKNMFDWMDTLDVLLIPSYQEGLPRVVVEAMSRGVLVIGSTAGGIYELIDKKYIFKKGSYHDLYRVMHEQLVNNTITEAPFLSNYNVSTNYDEYVLNKKRNAFYQSLFK